MVFPGEQRAERVKAPTVKLTDETGEERERHDINLFICSSSDNIRPLNPHCALKFRKKRLKKRFPSLQMRQMRWNFSPASLYSRLVGTGPKRIFIDDAREIVLGFFLPLKFWSSSTCKLQKKDALLSRPKKKRY